MLPINAIIESDKKPPLGSRWLFVLSSYGKVFGCVGVVYWVSLESGWVDNCLAIGVVNFARAVNNLRCR